MVVGIASLNPYSNGLPSRGLLTSDIRTRRWGLNPYSNGLPSRGNPSVQDTITGLNVLIPILMDYPLGACALHGVGTLDES